MAYQHFSAESVSPSTSSLTSSWATMPSILRSQDRDSPPESEILSGTLSSSSTAVDRNAMSEFGYVQNQWPNISSDFSTLHTNGGRQFAERVENNNGRSVSTDSVYGMGGDVYSSMEELDSGAVDVMGERMVAAGYSHGSSSAPQSATLGSQLMMKDSFDNSWESGVSNVDSKEFTDRSASGDESFDGGAQGEVDRSPYEPAMLHSLWTGPTPCYLGGCREGVVFGTPQSWHSHVKNVHKKTLHCPELNCEHTKPFANNTDLKRHKKTVHETKKPFKCERSSCTRTVKAWPRKDKLRLHDKKYHSHFRCFFCSEDPRHQRWFDTAPELWSHTTYDHLNG